MTIGGMRIFTISSAALKACPETIILPQHYRTDGTCLHQLAEREPVIFVSNERDDGPKEHYSGSKAVILKEVDPTTYDRDEVGTRYLIEFESGNRLEVSMTEVHPDESKGTADA